MSFQRVPLRRQHQRTVAACLEIAMERIGLSAGCQKELVAEMSDLIAESSETSGGFDNYFSLKQRQSGE